MNNHATLAYKDLATSLKE